MYPADSTKRLVIALVLATLLCTFGPPAYARSFGLYGTVVAPNAQAAPGSPAIGPAPGVTVMIAGTSLSDTTDARGQFHFKSVKEGTVTLVASRPGFPPTVKTITIKGPTPPPPVLIVMMPAGGATTSDQAPVKPDTVYVAFSSPVNQPGIANPPGTSPLSGPATTNMGALGAIANGADPRRMGGMVPNVPNGPQQMTTSITAAPNSLLVLDPDDPQSSHHVDTQARLFWLAFNDAGTKLFGATDQNVINIYDTVNNNLFLASIPTGGVVNDLVRVRNLVYAAIMRATGDGVMVIDPSRNAPLRIIPMPVSTAPHAHIWSVTASHDGSRIYMAIGNETQGAVVAVDAFSDQPLLAGTVGAMPMGIAITPDNRYLLVANSKAATVSILDASTLQTVATVPVGISPFHIAVRPDGSKAYVSCRESGTVCVINLTTLGPGAVIPCGSKPLGIAISSDGSHVYVANNGDATVTIIDGNTDTLEKTTTPQLRSEPWGVAIKP